MPATPALPLNMTLETEAGAGLGLLGNDNTVPSLLSALDDEREGVRRTAVWALGETEGEEAIDALVNLLGSDDRTVKDEAIDALVKIGDPAIAPVIEACGDAAKREAAIIVMEGLREKILMRQAVMRREGSSS